MSKGKKKRRNNGSKAKEQVTTQEPVRQSNSKISRLPRQFACLCFAFAIYNALSRQIGACIIFLIIGVVLWLASTLNLKK